MGDDAASAALVRAKRGVPSVPDECARMPSRAASVKRVRRAPGLDSSGARRPARAEAGPAAEVICPVVTRYRATSASRPSLRATGGLADRIVAGSRRRRPGRRRRRTTANGGLCGMTPAPEQPGALRQDVVARCRGECLGEIADINSRAGQVEHASRARMMNAYRR